MKRVGKAKVTKLGQVPRLAAIGLGALAAVTGNTWLLFMACAAAGIAIGAHVIRPRLEDFRVTVAMPTRTTAGAAAYVRFEVENTGSGWSPQTHLTHKIEGFVDSETRIDPIPPGGRVTAQFDRQCVARGIARGSVFVLSTSEPLGLLLHAASGQLNFSVIAHPQEVPVRVPTPRGGGSDDREWIVSRSGTDVHAIREWRPGDEASQVHWRSTARRGRLVVLEREIPRAGGLAIVLSAGSGDDSWERVVSVAGWTAAATARTGRPVALIAQQSGVQMVTGEAIDLLDWCASLGAGALAGQAEFERAAQFAGRGGDVLVACGSGIPRGWWERAADLARSQGVTLQPLDLADAS